MKIEKIITGLLAGVALFCACQKSQEYYDAVFFTGTESSPITNVYIDGPANLSLSITCSSKLNDDMDIDIMVDSEALSSYNADNGTEYLLLPSSAYELTTLRPRISSGSAVSEPIGVEILSMDDLEYGALYCLPLSITGTSNGMRVLEASRTTYIVFNQLIKTKGVDFKGSWHIDMEDTMRGVEALDNLTACTLEIRMYANGWSSLSHGISSLIGVEENYMLRIGDVSIGGVDEPRSILNIAGHGSTLSALDDPLSLGKWYHVAAVENGSTLKLYIDGVEVASATSTGYDAINLGFYYNSAFCIGRSASDYRRFNGYVSEARVWGRALTPVELVNNQCYVDPTTAVDLIGYWKLDEADGKIFRDSSGNGYDGTASTSSIVWTEEFNCPVVDY